jgi:hypothetical protein
MLSSPRLTGKKTSVPVNVVVMTTSTRTPQGERTINANSALADASGLSQLKTLGGSTDPLAAHIGRFQFGGVPKLVTFTTNLTQISRFEMSGATALTSLSFPKLTISAHFTLEAETPFLASVLRCSPTSPRAVLSTFTHLTWLPVCS